MDNEERKILEFAAKALGFTYVEGESWDDNAGWNSLHYSADCAAMCAKLDINTFWWSIGEVECISVSEYEDNHSKKHDGTDAGKEAAWRYAATMVAAKIGGYNGD